MKKYLKYGLYAVGVGIILAIIGSVTESDPLSAFGAILAFAGFIAWRKSVKDKEERIKDAMGESVQYGQSDRSKEER
jgi:uncharacterized membrane protein